MHNSRSREEDDAVALGRVYCGLVSADVPHGSHHWLSVAFVDDSGRSLEVCGFPDDATGYAQLCSLLQQRTGGATTVAFAADSDELLVGKLLAAAGRPVAFVDDDSAADYAERFADDHAAAEINAAEPVRRAMGLGRALQAGAISAVSQPATHELANLKPVLAAHAAVANGRSAAVATLREVLRELNPAALRAYPDPAEALPLAILDALPEPGLLSAANRGRDQAVASELVAAGFDGGQVTEAIAALRVAISESPRRTGVSSAMTLATAHTVRQAVLAIKASDSAAASLVSLLAERLTSPEVARIKPAARTNGKNREASVTQLHAVRENSARRPKPAPAAVVPLAVAAGGSYPPPPPASSPSPVYAAPVAQAPSYPASDHGRYEQPEPAPYAPSADEEYRSAPPSIASQRASRDNWQHEADYPPQPDYQQHEYQQDYRQDHEEPAYRRPAYPPPTPVPYEPPLSYSGDTDRSDRVAPPWQSMDLPPEPPLMRLVEHGRDGFAAPTYELVPPRPVVDLPYETLARPTSLEVDGRELGLGASNGNDDDLLIFTSTKSAWFLSESAPDTALNWNTGVDAGWLAAAQAAAPRYERETYAGLPLRVPQQNLVPGSPADLLGPNHPLRIRRDPASIAAHASGYFGGWRRGQSQVGAAVGGRPSGWDFSRDSSYNYR